jgi:Flp pilus assembly protein TadD
MTSLYDLLGARADDDEHAIKKAFRKAVKAHHPDLHPGDPDAALRFRRIITASAVLRDAKQRAAYDKLLALERRQVRLRLGHEHPQLQYRRRQIWWRRIGATAAVAAGCGLIYACSLFMPMSTAAIVAVLNGRPPAKTSNPPATAATIATDLGTGRKDGVPEVGPPAGTSKNAPAEIRIAAGLPETSGPQVMTREVMTREVTTRQVTANGVTAHEVTVHETMTREVTAHERPARADVAAAGIAEDAPKAGAIPAVTADKGDAAVIADRVVADRVIADRGEPASAAPVAMPHDVSFYRETGIDAYRLGDFPRAIVNLDMALRLDPNDAEAHNIRGNAFDEIGAFDNALADYDEAIRIDANNPVFFHDRAVLWRRRGNLDQALVDLDRAIRFSFSDPGLYCDRGLVWYEKGSHARAVADFDHAIKLDPKLAVAYISRGLILHSSGKFTAAFADLGRTIRVDPGVFDVSAKLK